MGMRDNDELRDKIRELEAENEALRREVGRLVAEKCELDKAALRFRAMLADAGIGI